ncbi:MAG: acyl carrier protein [Candidatus Thorarchaeota archaeon]
MDRATGRVSETDPDTLLEEIVSKVLLIDRERISDSLRRKDFEPWDSLAHLVLISEIENAFGVLFEDEEIVDIWTVGDLRRVLKAKL